MANVARQGFKCDKMNERWIMVVHGYIIALLSRSL